VLVNNQRLAAAFTNDTQLITIAPTSLLNTPGTRAVLVENPDGQRSEIQNLVIEPLRSVATVSAASFAGNELAPESIVAAFGLDLALSTRVATSVPLPTQLAGTSVQFRDSTGIARLAPLFFVAPGQINYQIPSGTASGEASIIITRGDGLASVGRAQIASVAPGLFSALANGQGVAAAVVLRVKADGSQSYEPVFQAGQAVPIDFGPSGDQIYLLLYGTGFRNNSGINNVKLKIGGVDVSVQYAGIAPSYVGLDQANAGALPRSLAGRGEVDVLLTVDGKTANVVKVNFR
ncbi:MAG: hypothetical protein KA368_15780, partial [Acidobacteria bacterium]|nr:hypothetical protein [Acidobacteriota bacterium]